MAAIGIALCRNGFETEHIGRVICHSKAVRNKFACCVRITESGGAPWVCASSKGTCLLLCVCCIVIVAAAVKMMLLLLC